MGKPTRELLFRLALNMGDVRLEMYLLLDLNSEHEKYKIIIYFSTQKNFGSKNFEFIGTSQFLKILKVHKIPELFKKC